MSRKGPSTIRRCGSLWAAAALVLGLPVCGADFIITTQSLTIRFPDSPALTSGYVAAPTYGTLGLYAYVPVTVICSVGSNLGQPGLSTTVPLGLATRVVGKGTDGSGAAFDTHGLWSPFTMTYMSAGDSTTVMFSAAQTCGIGIKARILRKGLVDAGGSYVQTVPASFTIIPTS